MSLEGPRRNHTVDVTNNCYSAGKNGKKEEKLDTSQLAANQKATEAFINKKNGSMGKRSFEDLTKKPPLGKNIPGPNPNLPSMRVGG